MCSRFFLCLAAVALIIFGGVPNLHADVPAASEVTADQEDAFRFTYTNNNQVNAAGDFVLNFTAYPNITTFLIGTPVPVTASSWDSPMGTGLLSWEMYTGMSYTQYFPGDPAEVTGIYFDFPGLPPSSENQNPVHRIETGPDRGDILYYSVPIFVWFTPAPISDTTSFTPLDDLTNSEISAYVPEPASLGLAALAVCGLAARRGRRQ